MTEAAFWWVNNVSVQTYVGNSNGSPVWADAQDVGCWVEDGNNLVRDGNGQEVVSSARVFAPLDQRATFAPGSKVDVNGRSAKVLSVAVFDSGSLDLGLDHVEVALT